MREKFKEALLHDLITHTFADMYAQTIAYGLFVARLNDTTLEDFSRQEARDLVSKNYPFLRQLFDYIAGANLDDNLKWIVDDLVEIIKSADLNKLLKDYGKTTQTTDPFLHFYETFLEKYDKVNKKKKGVYYTPQPVVRFIVSAVDTILKNDFKLAHGLADDTKTTYRRYLGTEVSYKKSKRSKKIYEKAETYKVQILDPATGTGTFLAETIRKIYSYFENQKGVWSQYVDKVLIPRLNGFEIMMTPYVMCHLKLDLLLRETNYTATGKPNRFNVYLTNSLEKDETTQSGLFDLWLSEEARQAGRIKSETPLMVIMGNPPYSVSSCNKSDYIKNLINTYKQNLNEKKLNLDDDYIKFIRIGEHYIEKNKEGILAYISNNSFIDGRTHRQMRKHLMETFDKIYILDLHGNTKKKECCPDGSKDENVFDIQQGVSINIFVKTGLKQSKKLTEVYHAELFGLRERKFDYLNNNEFHTIEYKKLEPTEPYYFFVPKDFSLQDEYEKGIKIDEIFIEYNSGIQTKRDDLTIHYTENEIRNVVDNFCNLSTQELKDYYQIKDTSGWNVESARNDILYNKGNYYNISYRPFDTRVTYVTNKSCGFIGRPRLTTFNHFKFKNLGLITVKQLSTYDFQHVLISNLMIESGAISLQTKEWGYIFPLYLYDNNTEQTSFFAKKRKPNLNMDIVHELEQKLGLTFTAEKENTENTFAPIDILDYVYGVLHSNKYRNKYKEFLKIDFPRIPYPDNANYFFEIAELGKELRQLHLMETPELENLITSYPVSGENKVDPPQYKDNRVYINKTQYFDTVPETAWNFYIGGYQPAQKWLKDRKGRTLSYDEIMHYQKIVVALVKTREIMGEIDTIINL